MSDLDPDRVHYLQGFTRLSLWYANKRLREGLGELQDTVNSRVNLYRNTSLYDGNNHPSKGYNDPEWNDIVAQLGEIFDQHGDDSDAVETKGLELLWPLIEARIREKGSEKSQAGERDYECWNYDYKPKTRVGIHIANVYQPKSPLSDMHMQFAASLIRLLRDAQVRRPESMEVQCGSWMNSTPRFQQLFPEAWKESAKDRPDIQYTMGSWGQFMDRKGRFHERNGAIFRETGKLPYASTLCYCSIEEALDHLAHTFPDAVAYNESIGYVPSA